MAHNDKMDQQIDEQLLELDQRFNQFMKELEEDFHFIPSVILNQNESQQKMDDRLAVMEKRYDSVDRKYKILLLLTGSITVGILVYLGYILFNI